MGLYSLLPATCQLHLSVAQAVPGKALLAVELLVTGEVPDLELFSFKKISAEQLGDSKRLSFSWFDATSDMDYIKSPHTQRS